jgi:3',5'-cyclic AMP phosphodiesterase CpdA
MINAMTRRDFLGRLVAGLALLAGGCSNKIRWPIHSSDGGSLRLVFYTDVHARLEWNTPLAMERAANAINAGNADLVITGGDLITEGFESSAARVLPRWEAYMRRHRAIKADLYPVIGNHDLVAAIPKDRTPAAKDPRAIYLARMGLDQTYYSFNAAGYHFVILDSIQVTGDEYQYQGIIWPAELEWMKQDLANVPPGTPIVLITHIPLLTAFYAAVKGATFAPPKNRAVVNNRDVLKVLENHNVILVLQGHLHIKELIKWRDTSFIVGGAVCAKWWRGAWYGTEEGFNIITLAGNHVEWEYIDYGWQARRPRNR